MGAKRLRVALGLVACDHHDEHPAATFDAVGDLDVHHAESQVACGGGDLGEYAGAVRNRDPNL